MLSTVPTAQLKTAPEQSETKPQTSTPTLDDYINEAKRLGQEQYAAEAKQLSKTAEDVGVAAGKKLYGRNFSLEGNAGQTYVAKSLQPILEQQALRGEAYAAQLGQDILNKRYKQEQDRVNNIITMTREGAYLPTEADKTALQAAGYTGEIKSNRDVTYGQNPLTGSGYTSDTEAKAAAEQKAFEQGLLNQYGINPITGQQFTDQQSASLYSKYGKNPLTGQLFTSEHEAQTVLAQQGFNQELINQYGVNPLTGKPFQNEQEALDSWQNRGYQKELVQQYGINPATGKPFGSTQEAVTYYTKLNQLDSLELKQKEMLQDLMAKYGTKPDGTPFQSEQEAQYYWNGKLLQSKYGTKDDGTTFQSEQEAVDYYKKKNFDTTLLQKYGLSPSGLPWQSEQAALDYYQKKGFNTDLMQKYGTKSDGTQFTNEQEAKDYLDTKKLNELKVNITDEALRDSIDSVEEFNHFMETGKTYENEIAEIMREQKSLEEWRAKLPILQKALSEWKEKMRKESAKPSDWYAGNRRNQGKLDYYTAQYNAILQAINEINGGKVPILEGY